MNIQNETNQNATKKKQQNTIPVGYRLVQKNKAIKFQAL